MLWNFFIYNSSVANTKKLSASFNQNGKLYKAVKLLKAYCQSHTITSKRQWEYYRFVTLASLFPGVVVAAAAARDAQVLG